MKDGSATRQDNRFDLVVIGAGSAGFSAAITAADAGKRVALVGHGTIGGTCVNVGCVPSKAMIRAAEAVHAGPSAVRFAGIGGCEHALDWPALVADKDALVASLRQKKYADLLPQYGGITYIDEGPASLVDGGVRVGTGTGARVLRTGRIIIATGSAPARPDIDGIETVPVLDSTALLALERMPESLIFVGGGYIGAELAQMMARFGVEVTLLTRSRLLSGADHEVSAVLAQTFRDEGIKLLEGLSYRSVSGDADGVSVTVAKDGQETTLRAAALVATAGRRANTAGLGLAQAGVETDARGSIVVGPDMATSAPGIYAAGDVTDRDRFVYMAAYGARLAARNAVLGGNERYDNAAMPWVVFTDPQVAGVGLSAARAEAAGRRVKTSTLPLDQVPRALAARNARGLIKLVADRDSDRLLGGQIIAPEGADSIQTLVLALKFGMSAQALGETIFPYLTTVEGLRLAAQTFDKDVARLSCCAG